MTSTLPQDQPNSGAPGSDAAAAIDTSHPAGLSEALRMLARLTWLYALPTPWSMTFDFRGVEVHCATRAHVDAWAVAMEMPTSRTTGTEMRQGPVAYREYAAEGVVSGMPVRVWAAQIAPVPAGGES